MVSLDLLIEGALAPVPPVEAEGLVAIIDRVLVSFGEHRVSIFAYCVEDGDSQIRLRFVDSPSGNSLILDFQMGGGGFFWNFGPRISEGELADCIRRELSLFARRHGLTEFVSVGVKASDLLATLREQGPEAAETHCIHGKAPAVSSQK